MGDYHDPQSGSLATSSVKASAGEAAASLRGTDSGPGLWHGFDLLSDVLETVRLRGALFFLWEASWPYTSAVPAGSVIGPSVLPGVEQIISYHIIMDGPCWAVVAGGQPIRLETGDIFLVPHGDAYVMASGPQALAHGDEENAILFFRQMAAGALPAVVREGGGGPQCTRVICGFLGCDLRPFNPVLSALPRVMRLRQTGGTDPLSHLIDFALAESRRTLSGGRSVLLRLSELMFIEVVRRYLMSAPDGEGSWLGGLRDPTVGQALILLHQRSNFDWTLESLAHEVGVARSTLAERFVDVVGEPPMQYLARWRMQIAARRLTDGPAKVYAVAQEVGYRSEAAFSRAFKRIVGVSPAAWREQRRQDPV